MINICIGILLAVGAWCDIKTKRLPVSLIIIGGMAGILYQCLVNGMVGIVQFSGMAVGMLMIGISRIGKAGIGLGDGVLFLVLGMFYRFDQMIELLMKASIMTGVSGLILMACKKGNLKTELPFIPFVCVQYVLLQIVNGGSW